MFTPEEFAIFEKILIFALQEADTEIYAISGHLKEEFQLVIEKLKSNESKAFNLGVDFTFQDLYIVRHALSIIGPAFWDDEYEEHLKMTEEEVNDLLKKVETVLRNNPDEKESYLIPWP